MDNNYQPNENTQVTYEAQAVHTAPPVQPVYGAPAKPFNMPVMVSFLMKLTAFFIPGLGQMISREVGRGFAWFGGAAAAYFVTGVGGIFAGSGQYYGETQLENTGAIIGLVGMLSMLTIDICAIVDAVRVAKVKNMYEQDLRKKYAFDVDFHPSVNYIQTADGVQPTAGLTLALKF